MKAAYADPPYKGLAKSHYKGHPDYDGEVNYPELIERLEMDGPPWGTSEMRCVYPHCVPIHRESFPGNRESTIRWSNRTKKDRL